MTKRTLAALSVVLVLCSVSLAEMQDGASGGQQTAADAMKCPPAGPLGIALPQTEGMEVCRPVAPQSAAPMMIREILETMAEMLKVQEKIVRGVGSAERKALLKDLARLREKVDRLLAAQTEMTAPRYPAASPDNEKEKQKGTEQQKRP